MMNATLCKCAVILAVAAFGSFWAGKSRATCYTGCATPTWVYDTGYGVTIHLGGVVPVILDTTASVLPLCGGGTSSVYRGYTNANTGYECSAGPSAYKGHSTYNGTPGGSVPVSKCGTYCT